nr:unnamed protein product [Callosobruchus analis]
MKKNKDLHFNNSPIRSLSPLSEYYDSDQDPPFRICEARRCKAEVFSSCHICNILLYWQHFMAETDDCLRFGHGTEPAHITAEIEAHESNQKQENTIYPEKVALPEDFWVDGNEKENPQGNIKKTNKQKNAKRLRDHGRKYFSLFKKMDVPASSDIQIDDGQRKKIFSDYYNLADLTRQRSFLIQHVTKENVKRKTVSTKSRRTCTIRYFFTVGNNPLPVCETFFLNTRNFRKISTNSTS